MRCVAITCARNEADIIEPFVRHTLAFCDQVIVLDHGSTDATPEILRGLGGEGLPLHVTRDESIGRMHVDHMNRLLRLAAEEFAADWILCLDADEFIAGRVGRSFLPARVDDTTPCLKIRPRTYYSQRADSPGVLNPVERITRRLAREPQGDGASPFKVLVPGPLAKLPGARLAAGNHLLRIDGVEAASQILDDVWLAHFSLRTPGQYAIKLASKRLHAHRFISPHGDEGAQYGEAYARMTKSYSAFAANFFEERLAYLPAHDPREVVADPLDYRGGPLRHTAPVPDMDNFARQMLILAESLALTAPAPVAHANGDVKHPLFTIEVFKPGGGTAHRCGDAARRRLEFPLGLAPGDDALHLRVGGEPGMLEITRFALVHPGCAASAEREFDADALRKNLRVVSDAAVLHSGNVYRLLLSREPAVLVFRNWRDAGLPPPAALRVEVRFDGQPDKSVLLHPAALNAMNRDAAAREIAEEKFQLLRERVKYLPGSAIDFSEKGDAILHTLAGWCNPESWGTWTEGNEATLAIRLAEIPRGGLVLNANVKALTARGQPGVCATVCVAGQDVATWTVGHDDFKQYRANIPASAIRDLRCAITFKIANPRSPAGLGISSDNRQLGLGFGSLELCA
ncbi:MAG TPA: glycosyltransferase family 2 protein [Chthoniobacteraceae bacterium]|nr:glycosyltransferase family 2 protein [Chthoniobacteraceae bacterium]